MNEEFREITGYEGRYLISNLGRVKAVYASVPPQDRERILKLSKNNKGYFYVDLFKYGKKDRRLVHRLVAEYFVDNPNQYPCVNHLDCDPKNNRVDNLEWCTHKQNLQYSWKLGRGKVPAPHRGETHKLSKLKYKQVDRMRKLRSLGMTLSDLSKVFGVHISTVSRICRDERYLAKFI